MGNQRFGSLLVPYFQPMVIPEPEGHWSLSEDYAFCERARQAGFAVEADTRIRLWHAGTYLYGWEDAGSSKERHAGYLFHPTGPPRADAANSPRSPDGDPGPGTR